jgi:hypothetical protein
MNSENIIAQNSVLSYFPQMDIKHSNRGSRRYGAAAAFVDQRLSLGNVTFPKSDLVAASGLSETAAFFQLKRLGRCVTRVSPRHPFFLIVSPEHRAVGAPPVAWWLDDYFRWLKEPYYLALQSAAGAFGSAPQALQVAQVMTATPRRPIAVGRIRVQFFIKRALARTPTQMMGKARAPLIVSTPEATAYDLVRYAPRIGGLARVRETLAGLLPVMRPTELRRVLRIENEVPVAQRLGLVFDSLKAWKLARVVQEWLPNNPPRVLLVHGETRDVPENRRWKVLCNDAEFRS